MGSKILFFVGGLMMLWVGASGLWTGEAGLTMGILLPAIRFKPGLSPIRYWLCVAFYLLFGFGLILSAVFREALWS